MGDCITYTHLKKFRKILNLNVLKFHANWKKVADGSHGSCNQNKGKLQNSWAVSWLAPRSVASKHLHPGNPRQSWSADSTSKPRNLIAQVMCQVASYEWRETKRGWQHNVPPSHNRKKGRRAHRWCLRAPDTLFRPPHAQLPNNTACPKYLWGLRKLRLHLSGCPWGLGARLVKKQLRYWPGHHFAHKKSHLITQKHDRTFSALNSVTKCTGIAKNKEVW